jgi:flavin-dependent dehydrogenase
VEATVRRDWDAVVVGAGPAGSMTALELARAGASVLLVERTPFPRWKVCGSCLSPGTQEVLRSAGLGHILPELGAPSLHTLRLAGWGQAAQIPLGPSVAVSRAALDAALVRSTREAGVTFLAPARATVGACAAGFRRVALEVGGETAEVEARVVVAADGLGSPTLGRAQALDAGSRGSRVAGGHVTPSAPIGFGALFPIDASGFEAGVIHMAVGAEGYVGAVRLEDGTLDVAAALNVDADAAEERAGAGRAGTGRASHIRPEEAVSRLLEGAGFSSLPQAPLEGWKGTPRLTRTVPVRGAQRVFAVGDAAGYVEPFTGEGVGWALAGARTLAPLALEGIRRWDPGLVRAWDRAYESTVGVQARLCRGLAWALRRPGLSRVGIHLLRNVPAVGGPFVRWAGRVAGPTHRRFL